jgi:hypothetical protein
MAEHLLAENGDNVLDVLLQLLEVSNIASHLADIFIEKVASLPPKCLHVKATTTLKVQ